MSDDIRNLKKRGMRLSMIIGRGFGIVILITLLSSAISIVGLVSTANEYQGLIDGAIELDEQSDQININLLQARRAEKDFLARADSKYLVLHDIYIAEIKDIVDGIITVDYSVKINNLANNIKSSSVKYDTASQLVFDKLISRGGGIFGPDNGTVGYLRDLVHGIIGMVMSDFENNLMNNTEHLQLHVLYLDIRKNEKDYLLRRNLGDNYQKYITNINTDITEFLTLIDTLNLASVRETEYHDDLGNYKNAIASLVSIDDNIDVLIAEFRDAAHEIGYDAEALEKEAAVLLEAATAKVDKNVSNTLLLSVLISVIIIIIGIVLTILITKSIVDPVYEIEEEVSLISNGNLTSDFTFSKIPSSELSTLGTNVVNMKQSLLSIIGSISSANKILNAASEDLFSGAEEINASAEEVATTSQAMSNGATTQTELIAEVNEDINGLIQMVEDIVKKIQTNTSDVSQIALQTNILALNAGIEASRAGDYGRGFMVVAENVRRLSDQSKDAAEKIALVADEIAQNLQSSFSKISNSIINIVSVSEETAASAEEVAAAAEEMTATVEELSSSAQELTTQAEASSVVISQFVIK